MKLKRKWPAYCIWILFIFFDVVMIAGSGFFSGLFPSDNRILYTLLLTVLAVAAMSVLTCLLGRLSDHFELEDISKYSASKLIFGIIFAIIVILGFIYRFYELSNTALPVEGKLSLYNNAVIGGSEASAEYDLLSLVYSALLKGIMFFAGNNIAFALIFEAACFGLFMVFAGLFVYKLLGAAASLVFVTFTAFMPVFTDFFRYPTINTDNLFYAMFGLELFVTALFLKGAYKKSYSSRAWVIWYLVVGAVVGFMAYMDAGTLITVAPLLLAVLFLVGTELKDEFIRLLFVLCGAAVVFAAMIIQEAGFMMGDVTLLRWASYYFHNLNTFSLFMVYTDYKLHYLITVIAMSGIIIGFWKSRKIDRVSPWLLSMIIIYVTVPFMGATRMNSQLMVTVFYGFMLSCLCCLIVTRADDDGLFAAVTEEAELGTDNEEAEGEKEAEKEEKEKEELPAQRYVPEGMVLPMETEADIERLDREPRMKMPEFKGTISLDRNKENIKINNEPEDDFDIPYTPGDEFDII